MTLLVGRGGQRVTVASKLITDRHSFWDEFISNYRYRIVLPEELNFILGREICGNFRRKSLSTDKDALLNSHCFLLQIQTLGSKRINSEKQFRL